MKIITIPAPNDPRLGYGHMFKVPVGNLKLTNVGLGEAMRVSPEHHVSITVIDKNDHMLSESEVHSGIVPINKKLFFNNVRDTVSLFESKNVSFFLMMQNLYDEMPVIAAGIYGDSIIINCLAGISRSSAITLWLMAHAEPNLTANELLHKLRTEVNFIADPNPAFIAWIEAHDERIPNFKGMKELCEKIPPRDIDN